MSKSSFHDCPTRSTLSLSFRLCVQESEFSVTKSSPADDLSSRLSSPCPSKSDPAAGECSTKSLACVLAALPAPPCGLKRKHSGDEPSAIFSPPSKIHRPSKRILAYLYLLYIIYIYYIFYFWNCAPPLACFFTHIIYFSYREVI